MQAKKENLATLLKLQEIDLELLRSQKKLNELPQRNMILALREKKSAIDKKQFQVTEMKKGLEHEILRIDDEDERLVAKQDEVQEKINSVKGDYRAVEAFTKELSGIAKRRNTLETNKEPLSKKLAEIEQVLTQALDALEKVSSQEAEVVASFKQEGGALNNQIAQLQKSRDTAFASLEAPLAQTYEKTLKRLGGVAVARLTGNLCSVCRNALEEGKLLQVKGEAPLSECPYCKRLLVVEDDV